MKKHVFILSICALPIVVFLFTCLQQPEKYNKSDSTDDHSIPPPPENLNIHRENEGILIVWDEVEHATSYNLYWSEQPTFTKQDANKIERFVVPRFRHSIARVNKSYFYAVTSIGSGGESELSTIVSTEGVSSDLKRGGVKASLPQTSIKDLSMSGDGNMIVYSSSECDPNEPCIYLLKKNQGKWGAPKLILSFKVDRSHQGPSVKLNSDGSRLLFSNDQGVFIATYDSSTDKWGSIAVSPISHAEQVDASSDFKSVVYLYEGIIYSSRFEDTSWTAGVKLDKANWINLSADGNFICYERSGVRAWRRSSVDGWSPETLGPGRKPNCNITGDFVTAFSDDENLITYQKGRVWQAEEQIEPKCCAGHLSMSENGADLFTGQVLLSNKDNRWVSVLNFDRGINFSDFDQDGKTVVFVSGENLYVINRIGQYWTKAEKIK